MTTGINRVAVLGAGTMGGGIAALLAGQGIPLLLLDLPGEPTPEDGAKGLTADSPKVRNRVVESLWERQVKA